MVFVIFPRTPRHLTIQANQSRGNRHVDASAAGSVVVHDGGVTLGQPVGETFAIAEVPNVSGAPFRTESVRTDPRGYAVVPYLHRIARTG
ncbi:MULTISPECIES: fimbria/pilus outer membrane usher protein [Burkholderia cepacia complex]|nr:MULTISPECIES: fimbria/pilus outer membrane usher protein [Burkholderia cepacia complex]